MSDQSQQPSKLKKSRAQRIARLLTGTTVAAAVAALAASGLPAWATSPTPGLPAKDIANWTMPLDRFIPASSVVADYAENLSTVPCMAQAGFDWPIPKRDIEAAANRIGDVTINKPLSKDVASERGYHPAPTDDPGQEATLEMNATSLSESEDAALTQCLHEVRKTLRLPSSAQQEAGRDAVILSNAAYEAAQADGAVVEAAGKWTTCMSAAGVRDLPRSPAGMPSAAIADRLGTMLSTVHPEEKEVALTDVQCQISSGYRHALYDAEWAHQSVVPAHDAKLFANVGNETKNSKTQIYATIANDQSRK